MSKRTRQVADTMQRVLGDVIQREVKDPRVGFATVTGVEVSEDLQHARVRVSIMGDEKQRTDTMQGLQRAKGFLRKRVAEEMNHLRFVPEIRLELDTSLDYCMHIQAIFQELEHEQSEKTPHSLQEQTDENRPKESCQG